MDDRFLDEQRREPRPEFARSLREKLRATDVAPARPAFRLHPAFAGALAAAAFAASFAFPAVRATAQSVLDLFRVRDFAVVQVDETRLAKLRNAGKDPAALIGSHFEKLQEPGPTRRFADVASAEMALGHPVMRPWYVDPRVHADSVFVCGEGRARVTIAEQPIRDLMDLMDVRDLQLPSGLDGQRIEFHIPQTVSQTFVGEKRRVVFVQAESPEISLPPGADLARLGEIGLRIMGVERSEAHRLAGAIDWRGTVLVPVTPDVTQYRQVTVAGARGLLLETGDMRSPDEGTKGPGTVVTWTRDGRVYGMMGRLPGVDLIQMAESVR